MNIFSTRPLHLASALLLGLAASCAAQAADPLDSIQNSCAVSRGSPILAVAPDPDIRQRCYALTYHALRTDVCVSERAVPSAPYVSVEEGFDPQRVTQDGWPAEVNYGSSNAEGVFASACGFLVSQLAAARERHNL